MSDTYGNADALAQIETELGKTMTHGGLSYPCIIGARTDTREVDYGGYSTGATIEIVVRTSLFNIPPAARDIVEVDAKGLIIKSIAISHDGSCYVLSCDDENKDA